VGTNITNMIDNLRVLDSQYFLHLFSLHPLCSCKDQDNKRMNNFAKRSRSPNCQHTSNQWGLHCLWDNRMMLSFCSKVQYMKSAHKTIYDGILCIPHFMEMKPHEKSLGRNPLSDAPYRNTGMVLNGQGLGDASGYGVK
jgi:hypothetical protein